jgi:hypothetical protein
MVGPVGRARAFNRRPAQTQAIKPARQQIGRSQRHGGSLSAAGAS